MQTALVWFKRDLRIHDHAALVDEGGFTAAAPLDQPDLPTLANLDGPTPHHGPYASCTAPRPTQR